MFARRRPLLRAAVVGGGAYIAGKRSAQRSDQQSMSQSAASQPSMSQPSMSQSATQTMQPQVPQQGGNVSQESATPSVSDQLAQLSTLHKQGSLSDAEFATAKSKLLGS